jgi:hypothetical protein
MSENQKMERMRQNIQEFISNPVGKTRELSHDYGLDKMELSKIVIITSTALLVVSINAVYTMQSVQSDLKQTDQSVQQASAVINSDRFQDAMNTLQRIESDRLTNQLQAAEESLNNLDSSFENVNTAQDKVDQTQRTYQWMSLISILGIISGVALRYM